MQTLTLEERLKMADKISLEIRNDLYCFVFNHPYYCGGIDMSDDECRHKLLDDYDIPRKISNKLKQ